MGKGFRALPPEIDDHVAGEMEVVGVGVVGRAVAGTVAFFKGERNVAVRDGLAGLGVEVDAEAVMEVRRCGGSPLTGTSSVISASPGEKSLWSLVVIWAQALRTRS